jgi:hypothetical protein
METRSRLARSDHRAALSQLPSHNGGGLQAKRRVILRLAARDAAKAASRAVIGSTAGE